MPGRLFAASVGVAIVLAACGGAPAPTTPPAASQTSTPFNEPSPTTATTQMPTAAPPATTAPMSIGALVDQVFDAAKSGGFKKTTTAEVEAAIAAAITADPATASWKPRSYGFDMERSISSLFEDTDGSPSLRGCEAKYDNSVFGGPNEEITFACTEVAEYLYVAYSRNQSQAFVVAFSDFISYLKTRADLNGSHQAADEIIGFVRDCLQGAGSTFKICENVWYP